MAIKVAFGSVPKDSGTFTFYRNQRPALKQYGIDMYCVTVGKEEAELVENDYLDENCVLLATNTYNFKKQSQSFVKWVIDNEIDIVIAVNSKAILSSIPHLPQSVRLVARCANAFDYGYRITMSGRDRLMAIVALTPRLRDDLVNNYQADKSKLHLIPNGIIASNFKGAAQASRGVQDVLRLVFIGRLEHIQKGVLFIPNILQELDKHELNYKLIIAGKGKHQTELEEALQNQIKLGRVEFIGAIGPKEIPTLLGRSDIYLFTSQFEGCPNSLLEAMMAGCVPLVYNIPGITDFLIKHGETGFTIEKENAHEMAKYILSLDRERNRLKEISSNASKEALRRFSNEVCAAKYSKVFEEVMQMKLPETKVRSWNDFEPDVNIELGKYPWVPTSLKKSIKKILGKV